MRKAERWDSKEHIWGVVSNLCVVVYREALEDLGKNELIFSGVRFTYIVVCWGWFTPVHES